MCVLCLSDALMFDGFLTLVFIFWGGFLYEGAGTMMTSKFEFCFTVVMKVFVVMFL